MIVLTALKQEALSESLSEGRMARITLLSDKEKACFQCTAHKVTYLTRYHNNRVQNT